MRKSRSLAAAALAELGADRLAALLLDAADQEAALTSRDGACPTTVMRKARRESNRAPYWHGRAGPKSLALQSLGQEGDVPASVRLPDRRRPDRRQAFKADDRVIRSLAAAGKPTVVPPRRSRLAPRDFDHDLYKARHLVENFFAELKQFRAIATRYDKTARNFLAALHLAAATIWLN
jgi:hypothetical protein